MNFKIDSGPGFGMKKEYNLYSLCVNQVDRKMDKENIIGDPNIMVLRSKRDDVKCDNCHKVFKYGGELNLNVLYKQLFHSTCMSCLPTCNNCGQESGFVKNDKLISVGQCGVCDRETCRSCGVNIECDKCGFIACENCIQEEGEDICQDLKYKLWKVRKYKYKY